MPGRQRLRVERGGEPFAQHHAAERNVPRRDALGERDQIGDDAEAFAGERRAGAAEAGHHLVEDQHDAVRVAQRA